MLFPQVTQTQSYLLLLKPVQHCPAGHRKMFSSVHNQIITSLAKKQLTFKRYTQKTPNPDLELDPCSYSEKQVETLDQYFFLVDL